MLTDEGHWIVGGVPSPFTVIVNVQVLRLLQSSVAVQLTVLVPMGNKLLEAGVQVTATV